MLRVPFSPRLIFDIATEAWLFLALDRLFGRSAELQIAQLRSISASDLRAVLSRIYLRCRDPHPSSDPPAVRASFYRRCVQPMTFPTSDRYEIVRCYEPMYRRFEVSADSLVLWILSHKYSPLICNCMCKDQSLSVYKGVSEEVIRSCLQRYYERTAVTVPLLCAVCSRARVAAPVTKLVLGDVTDNFEILRIDRPVSVCLQADDLDVDLIHENPHVNGLMLDKAGMGVSSDWEGYLHICNDFLQGISQGRVPRYALANRLNRGHLPIEFDGLTWVGEMVCSIYRTNAISCGRLCIDRNSRQTH